MPRPFQFRGTHGGRREEGRVFAVAHDHLDHTPDLGGYAAHQVTPPLGCANRLPVAARARTASGGPAGRGHQRLGRYAAALLVRIKPATLAMTAMAPVKTSSRSPRFPSLSGGGPSSVAAGGSMKAARRDRPSIPSSTRS